MAIIGGAGNPIGGSFTGPAEALEIVGDFCYAYSGAVQTTTSLDTVLNFKTGNFITEATFYLTSFVDPTSVGAGGVMVFQLQFNGSTVLLDKSDTGSEQMPTTNEILMIIPPYTEVNLKVIASSASGGFYATQCVTGKIHRTRD